MSTEARREDRAIATMNQAAHLPGGYDAEGRRQGISCGYIGNCSMRPGGYDDRAWGFFRPHPKADQRMIGHYSSFESLLDSFDHHTDRFLKWAQGAKL